MSTSELVDVGLDAMSADPAELPAAMSARILGAAQATGRPARHSGWATDDGQLTSHATFITTVAELSQLLSTLAPADWMQPTEVAGGMSVRDLVLHLVGVERYLLGQLGRADTIDAPTVEHHFPVLHAAASADLGGADAPAVARAWWLAAMDLVAATAEIGPDQAVTYHDLAGSVGGMLVIRTFEVWTHDDDIRRAVGLPLNVLDDARLSLMSSTLMGVLPYGLARAGTVQAGRTVRFDLTGPGGGAAFVASLSPDEPPGDPDLVIETSALDLCRLASNRMSIDDIDVRIDGDRSLLRPVLVGAGAFAMD
ncbi:MAG: maleylpyruvate isomerase family mycothiol-dependent enzyme [Acidimicrobiia bacterium]|nr:maleylpyruvate isomerase family mycothiol-dependent enzyme [Acidimicrobiia bacterium]